MEHTTRRRYPGPTIVFFCVLLGLFKSTVGQSSYYNSCFDQIRKADDNANLLLSKEEYSKFLITVSGGAILLQNETPPILSNPYTLRQNANSQQLNIRGIDALSTLEEQSEMESFCQQIYSGLASILGIQIEVKTCTDAFRMSDSNPQNDVLSSKEYAFFVVNISKDVSLINSSFGELTSTIKDVFNDMRVDNGIPATLGEEYLMQFCERTAIAAKIGEVVYATMPTETPSKAPITKEPVTTSRPTTTTSAPVSNSPIPFLSEEHTKCKTNLIVSDLNRNSLLDADEFGNFLKEISNKRVSAADFSNLDIIFQEAYKNLTKSSDAISLSGFRPGLTPSKDEYQTLIQICNQAYTALDKYEKKELDAPGFHPSISPAVDSNSTQLSEVELKTCKKFMVLSDSNRNSVLDETEFVTFVSRMTTTQDFSGYEFDDLDVSFRSIYEGKSKANGGIDIDGSKPGQESTPAQEKQFRILCTDVIGAIVESEANAPTTKGPIAQSSPSQAPSTSVVEISDEFFRVCKTAMLIADRNRDDVLEAEEYVRFLNRLTISEFSGDVFADLEPSLQQGFFRVAVDGKVNVYGSKPGTTTSDEEVTHLRHVCESVHVAIEGYHGRNGTEIPKSDCETKLWNADRNSDDKLDKSEYVAYLRSITRTNYTKFDALPYLLRDQYDWFRLGKDTINIKGLANHSMPLQGDKVRISWICDRTSKSIERVSTIGKGDKFTDYCDAALRNADNNTDGFLDDDEFISLIHVFTVTEQPRYNLSAVDDLFLESYERFKDAELNLIKIKVAKSDGLCEGLATATNSSRERETLFRICKDSLKLSDIDGNGRLNQTEYIPFIDNIVTAYNLTISAPGDFEVLKSSNAGIDIHGLYNESSIEEELNLRHVCMVTGYAFGIIQNTDVESVTVYNSFTISNDAGMRAEHLTPTSTERIGLNKAYAAFVDYEVKLSIEVHGRFLLLRSAKISESEVYQIIDVSCPNGNTIDESCQTAFASFNVTVSTDDESLSNIGNLLSNKTQNAIDRGALQLTISTVDPNNTLKVIKSSLPVIPAVGEGEELETVDEPDDNETTPPTERENFISLAAIAGAAVGVSAFGAALFFLFVSRQKKRKTSGNTEKEVLEVNEMNTGKLPCPFDDNMLEEGRKPTTVNRFIFSQQHSEDDGTCGLSETNDSSFRNVSTKISPAFKIDDRNEVSALSFPDSRYVNTNSDFQINDESDSSLDTEEVTSGTFGFQVEDKCGNVDKHFPPSPFTIAPHIAAPATNFSHNAGIVIDTNGSDIVNPSTCNATNDGDLSGENDESGSFEEVEIESDDEIEENKVEENEFEASFSVEEYEDGSDEEIEISVHDDEEGVDEAISGIKSEKQQKVQNNLVVSDLDVAKEEKHTDGWEKTANLDVGHLNSIVGEVRKSEKDLHGDSCIEKVPETGDVGENSQSDSLAHVDESNNDTESEKEVETDDEVEASKSDNEDSDSDDESQYSDTGEQEDLSTNSDDAEAIAKSYQKYRPVIEELIRQVMPDEIDNIDVMMEQFIGNEKELVTSLRNMAGIDDTDDDGSGSYDSETTSDDSNGQPIAKVETSTSEEEESEDEDESESEDEDEDDNVKPIAKVETSTSEEEESDDEGHDAKPIAKVETSTSEEEESEEGTEDDDDNGEEESESEDSDASEEEKSEESEDEEEDEEEEEDDEEESESSEEERKVHVRKPESDDSEDDDDSSEYESD